MDRRLTPFSGQIAHISLKGQIEDTAFTQGFPARVAAPLTAICDRPEGAVDRQLLLGDALTIIDENQGWKFVMAEKDGYCGWVHKCTLDCDPKGQVTHRVISPATHAYDAPRVQATHLKPLYLNSRLEVLDLNGAWAETTIGFVPANHLAPLDQPAKDPTDIAESLIGRPYLWAGNSAAGLDCSGLVQLAFHAAGIPCPADSDLQARAGSAVTSEADLTRGDLVLWKGHVAIFLGNDQILHANGYTMSVAREGFSAAKARISAHYGGDIIALRRLIPKP